MLGNYGNGPNEMIDRENSLVGAHRIQAVKVNYCQIRPVEFTVRRPIGNQPGVTCPKNGKAIGEADDVPCFAPLVTGQPRSHTRPRDSYQGIDKYGRGNNRKTTK